MASIRKRVRRDGTPTWNVMYGLKGRQTSVTFTVQREAEKFREAVDTFGAERAMEAWGIGDTIRSQPHSLLVEEWLEHHINHLTGVTKATLYDYSSYARNDINPVLGAIPLTALSRDDVARWVQGLAEKGASGKTIANKHGFLSAALNAAVHADKIPANPALKTRLPRTEKPEIMFLSKEDFNRILVEIPPYWRPFTRFLVASGCRFGEASALRPSDVDRTHNVVKIRRAFKRTYEVGGYELGPTKTRKSNRDISIDKAVLDELDYTGEWLFTNSGANPTRKGGPVRISNFRTSVWWPAIKRAKVTPRPRVHDLRHTCASWLIQAGLPLPVIQQHMGHESIEVTVGVYGHLDRRSADAAAAVLAGILDAKDV